MKVAENRKEVKEQNTDQKHENGKKQESGKKYESDKNKESDTIVLNLRINHVR